MADPEKLLKSYDGTAYCRILETDSQIAPGDRIRVMGIDPEFVKASGSTLNPRDVYTRRGLGTYGIVDGIKKMEQGFMGGVPDAYFVSHKDFCPGTDNKAAYALKELSRVSETEYQQALKRRK